ncbi:MAG: 30S ribosomal protein S9 [Armatimonadetes bacterium]|nr:30S ribosomal protein S9 [Armatimonadota bacterium]NIM23651.1 30S ribosomal protein S9 [Armatimonadota bacterium]NIM67521.1 30S ribosomal protein S9 [Armatimonadota bacterium]NIM76043.1 30S ribosomal protein S9 [Armatimonadota bacterium]NIN05707.1 30S ribosomal protein S9 [Armatimonadota bacterium]
MPNSHYATGHRKTSAAKVWLFPGTGEITINGKPAREHFQRDSLESMVQEPFEVTQTEGRFDVKATCVGGGIAGQAGALRHGISRALVAFDESLRTTLRRGGFLTRDPRVKERKHAGFRRARRGKQFSKR